MKNTELDKIIASLETAVHKAYALGRRDALDHVARWAQTEETTSTHLALVAPAEHNTRAEEPAAAAAPAATERVAERASERGAAGRAAEVSPPPRGFGALLLDYVYPTG